MGTETDVRIYQGLSSCTCVNRRRCQRSQCGRMRRTSLPGIHILTEKRLYTLRSRSWKIRMPNREFTDVQRIFATPSPSRCICDDCVHELVYQEGAISSQLKDLFIYL